MLPAVAGYQKGCAYFGAVVAGGSHRNCDDREFSMDYAVHTLFTSIDVRRKRIVQIRTKLPENFMDACVTVDRSMRFQITLIRR